VRAGFHPPANRLGVGELGQRSVRDRESIGGPLAGFIRSLVLPGQRGR
jgi:hypothetical protein